MLQTEAPAGGMEGQAGREEAARSQPSPSERELHGLKRRHSSEAHASAATGATSRFTVSSMDGCRRRLLHVHRASAQLRKGSAIVTSEQRSRIHSPSFRMSPPLDRTTALHRNG